MSLRFVLFGHPVAHSVSPAIHAAAYQALGLPHRYELCDAPDEAAFARGVAAVRSGDIAGANVTVPYKRAALRLADRPDPNSEGVGAANTLRRAEDGSVVAHNTDVPALAQEIARLSERRARVLVLGSGGAALAAVAAARALGATSIGVSARRFQPGTPKSEWSQAGDFTRLGAEPLAWSEERGQGSPELLEFFRRADVIVQATSAGMHGAEPGETISRTVPWEELAKSVLAYDLVYNPRETDFLKQARARGLPASDGLGMLVGQAALALELWLGVRPESAPLLLAAEAALRARQP